MAVPHLTSVRHEIGVPAWITASEPEPPLHELSSAVGVDVAIVGAGYTGLSAAIELASRGASVAVLDAGPVGAGASGRNGGQINPGLRQDPEEAVAKHGAIAEDLLAFAGSAPDKVFALVERYGIKCDIRRSGWLMLAHRAAARPVLERRAAAWIRRGVRMQMFEQEETEKLTGSRQFAASLLDPRGGNLQPLSYVRGLARAALSEGAKIYADTPVRSLAETSGGWLLKTNRSTVKATRVLLATNGYTDSLWPRLKRTIVPVQSFQIATVPLGMRGKNILPHGHHCSETRRMVQYFAVDADGRLLLGGKGRSGGPRTASDFEHLYRALQLKYPELSGVEIDFAWSGRVALTADYLPHVHQLAPGLFAALGYQGRGVAMASALGQSIGAHIFDAKLPVGIHATPPKEIPFHGLNQVYASIASTYFRLRDL